MNWIKTPEFGFSLVLIVFAALTPCTMVMASAESTEKTVANEPAASPVFGAEAAALRARIDRSQFDVNALLDRLDYDPEAISAFVRDEIAVEIYPGALRGATGALMSRAGNALDQALLLASLLRFAGEDAVIHRAKLPDDIASELVGRMALPRPAPSPVWKAIPGQPGTSATVNPETVARQRRWYETAHAGAEKIGAALAKARIGTGSGELMQQLVREATDYYWVERLDVSTDKWLPLHPALGRDPGVTSEQAMPEEIPIDLAHVIRFELLLDRRIGAKTETVNLMSPIERTSVELIGKPLTLALLPDQFLNPEGSLDPEAIARQTHYLFPILDAGLAPGAQALSLRGLTLSPDVMQMGASGIFETISEKVLQANDALAGADSDAASSRPGVAIEGIRIRVTFSGPGGRSRVEERRWFDPARDLTPAARAQPPGADLVMALVRTQTFVSAVGAIAPGFVVDAQLQQIQAIEALRAHASALMAPDCKTMTCLKTLDNTESTPTTGAFGLFSAFDVVPAAADSLVFRHAPNLLAVKTSIFDRFGQAHPPIDILANARRAFTRSGNEIRPDTIMVITAGVWETQAETLIPATLSDPDAEPQAVAAGLRSMNREEVEEMVKTQPLVRDLLRDLDAGYVVLADQPPTAWPDQKHARWWRVDPLTGESLGMTPYGGATTAEYFILAGAIAVPFLTALSIVDAQSCASGKETRGPAFEGVSSGDRFQYCFACRNLVAGPALKALMAVNSLVYDATYDQLVDGLQHLCYKRMIQ